MSIKVRVNYKKPMAGMVSLYLQPGEKLQVYRGKGRRVPKDDEKAFNTVPLNLLTSIEVIDDDTRFFNTNTVSTHDQIVFVEEEGAKANEN